MSDNEKDQINFPFIVEPIKSDYVIKKHKGIIHRTHLPTAVEEKIFNGFLLAAKVAIRTGDIEKFRKEGFLTSDKFIRNFSGLKIKDKEYIVERVKLIQSSVIRFDYFDQYDTFKELRTFQPLGEVRFLEGGGVRFFLPPSLLEAVSDPETFATIDTQITSRFTSVYAIALYEMGVLHMGDSLEFKTLKEFREYMGLKPDEYTKSTDLRRYVIEKGCNEVNLKSGMNIIYELIKEGRGAKVTGIKFTFSEAPEPLEYPSTEMQLQTVAKYIGMLPLAFSGEGWVVSLLLKHLEAHGEEWVQSNMESFLTRLKDRNQPPVNKPGALLQSTFKHDYGKDVRNAKRVAEILAQQEEEKQAKKQQMKGKNAAFTIESEQEALEAREREKREKKYLIHFNDLPLEIQENIFKDIERMRELSKPPFQLYGTKESKITYYLSEIMGITL